MQAGAELGSTNHDAPFVRFRFLRRSLNSCTIFLRPPAVGIVVVEFLISPPSGGAEICDKSIVLCVLYGVMPRKWSFRQEDLVVLEYGVESKRSHKKKGLPSSHFHLTQSDSPQSTTARGEQIIN